MSELRDLTGRGPTGNFAGPRAFFKTVAGPGVYPSQTAYPTEASKPNVYYARMLKNVTFPRIVGTRALGYAETNQYDFLFNLEPDKYIEVGSIVMCFRENGQWFTIDKVRENPCCQSRLFKDGGVQTLTVEFELWGDTTRSAGGSLRCPTEECRTLLATTAIDLTYESVVPEQYDEPLNLITGEAHPIGRVIHRPSGWYVSSSREIGDLGNLVFNGNSEGRMGRVAFLRLATFTTENPTAVTVPGIGTCVLAWVFDDDLQETAGGGSWDKYLVDFRSVCFETLNPGGFRGWRGVSPGPNLTPYSYRGAWFAGVVPTTCTPVLANLDGPYIYTARTELYPGAIDYELSCGGNVSNLRSTMYLRGTVTE